MYIELTAKQFCGGLIALAAIGAVLFFVDLGNPAFLDYDEAQYAQVINDTQDAGNRLSLVRLGVPWFDKPPLYFWLAMGSGTWFESDEFAYRLPSAMIGLIGVLLTVAIARYFVGRTPLALVSGAALMTTGAYLQAARQLRLDVPVAVTLLFSFYCFLRGDKDSRWYLLWGPSIALAVLLKSAVGVLGLLFVLVWAVGHRNFSFLKSGHFWWGAFLGGVVLVPWYAYQTVQFGMLFWNEHVFRHVVDRFSANILGGNTTNWVYLQFGVWDMLPWSTAFVIGYTSLFFARGQSTEKRDIVVLGAIACSVFALFALGKTKLFYYLVPAMPFVALVSVLSVAYLLKQRPRLQIAALTALLVIGSVTAINIGFSREEGLATVAARAEEERAAGALIKEQGKTGAIRALMYPHWDSLIYYSGGLRVVELRGQEIADEPFPLVLPTALYDKKPFAPETASRFKLGYKGQQLVLLFFTPTGFPLRSGSI